MVEVVARVVVVVVAEGNKEEEIGGAVEGSGLAARTPNKATKKVKKVSFADQKVNAKVFFQTRRRGNMSELTEILGKTELSPMYYRFLEHGGVIVSGTPPSVPPLGILALGFAYVPSPMKNELDRRIAYERDVELGEVANKVGRCLNFAEVEKIHPKETPVMRAPPSTVDPKIRWLNFPEWNFFFESVRRDLNRDRDLLGKYPNPFLEARLERRNIEQAIQNTLASGHLFVEADKDRSPILIARTTYFEALEILLGTLDVTRVDTTCEDLVIESKTFTDSVLRPILFSKLEIPVEVRKWLVCHKYRKHCVPLLKMTFKTHKEVTKWWSDTKGLRVPPARPIVTQHSWITVGLSKVITTYLLEVLRQVKMEHPIVLLKNSYEFVADITRGKMVGDQCFGITGDFDSLYSNIPVPLVYEAISHFAFKYIPQIPQWRFLSAGTSVKLGAAPKCLPQIAQPRAPTFLNVLLFLVLTLNTFLAPNGLFYAQKRGVAMGLGAAPLIADIALAYLEAKNKQVFQNMVAFRYLDDMCIISSSNNPVKMEELVEIARIYPMKVTWDPIRHDKEQPFLDVLLVPSRKGLQCATNFKISHNGHYIPFQSHHPRAQLTSWLRGELIRYVRISSEKVHFLQARNRLILAAWARGYPASVLLKAIHGVQWEKKPHFELKPRAKPGEEEISVAFKMTFSSVRKFPQRMGPDGRIRMRMVKVPSKSLGQIIQTAQKYFLCPPVVCR